MENGLTALLISDTHSVTHCTHKESDLSTTDDDEEDTCSEDIEGGCDDDDDFDDDDVDGMAGGPDEERDNHEDRSRKFKDTKLVSSL